MPHLYRKRPVQVEVIQFTEETGLEILKWIGKGVILTDSYIQFTTMEGDIRAKLTDYIIKGVHGEFYPCDAEVFEKTYDKV